MPEDNEMRPCTYKGYSGVQTLRPNAAIAGSLGGVGTGDGRTVWGASQPRAWLCNKNAEHYELVDAPSIGAE
jgi:hypothetical protein